MRAADWIGGVGETWAREWPRTDRSFAGLEGALERVILARSEKAGTFRMVDLGCGAGTTSLAIAAARPDVEVIGLDLSADLIAVAEARRQKVRAARCRFIAGDAIENAAALGPVDLFFSRHGVMFFDDPIVAFGRLAAAAAPHGRLVFSCFAALVDNPWATIVAAPAVAGEAEPRSLSVTPGPFAFADPSSVLAILADSGWRALHPPERIAFRYVAGSGADPVADALSFFRRIGPAASAIRQAAEADRPALLDRLEAACRRHLDGGEVAFPATAWLWSAQTQEPTR